jgi:hypothetical protein
LSLAAQGYVMLGFFKKRPEKTVREYFRACNVYCQPAVDQVVVAAVYNHGGLMAEMPGGATVVKFTDTKTLHEAVRSALENCVYEENFNYSDLKRSDWPAYQASGYKTIKRFEADFVMLLVKGVNDANLFYDVTAPEFGKLGLHLTVTVNGHSGNYGEAIHYIIQSYMACKAIVSS